MKLGTSQSWAPVVIVAVVSLGANPGWAQTLNPISQNRFTQALTLEAQCGGEFFHSDEAPGFAPFDGHAISEVACNLTFSFAQALQQSQINPTSLIGSGSTLTQVVNKSTSVVVAIPDSFYRVTFELDSASHFTLAGQLSEWATSVDNQLFAGASFELTTGPNNQVILSHSIATIPGGAQAGTLDISHSGVLDPGVYTLTASASTVFDSSSSPGGDGEATFDFTFELVACPADLNGDSVTNGSDLAILLTHWGANGGADLNGDGIVNGADLATLLTNWGACV